METLKYYWEGKGRLWKIYWIGGIAIGLIIAIACGALIAIGVEGYSVLAPIVAAPFTIWWCISTWRCSENTDTKIWTILARIIVVLEALSIVSMIITALVA